jgi:hypothetical protein
MSEFPDQITGLRAFRVSLRTDIQRAYPTVGPPQSGMAASKTANRLNFRTGRDQSRPRRPTIITMIASIKMD